MGSQLRRKKLGQHFLFAQRSTKHRVLNNYFDYSFCFDYYSVSKYT